MCGLYSQSRVLLIDHLDTPIKKVSSVVKTSKPKSIAASSASNRLPRVAPTAVKMEQLKPIKQPNAPTNVKQKMGGKQAISASSLSSIDVLVPDPVASQIKLKKDSSSKKASSVSKAAGTSSKPSASVAAKQNCAIKPKDASAAKPPVSLSSVGSSYSGTLGLSDPSSDPLLKKEQKSKSAADSERNEDGLPIVSSKMTMSELKQELLFRTPGCRGHSKLKSGDFLVLLRAGSVWESHPESRRARDRDLKTQHCIVSLAHCCPMADSSVIRCPVSIGTEKTRVQTATCDDPRYYFPSLCRRIPYRSCAKCDFDLCLPCFELESLPEAEKKVELDRIYAKIAEENEAAERRYEEQEEQEEARRKASERQRKEEFEQKHAAELKRFPKYIRDPPAKQLDQDSKLQFTVWTSSGDDYFEGPPSKQFNSSFATLEDANKRVEFVFLFQNPWGFDLDEMHTDVDSINNKGLRRMEVEPDDCERWTVSVIPSQVFEYLNE